MGEQSSSQLKGDDYQHLYSWFELLQLLGTDTVYSYGFVEHPTAGAADDITLHSNNNAFAKYTQVKFHVDQQSQYSSTSVVEIPLGSKRSILHKLFDSWKSLRAKGKEIRIGEPVILLPDPRESRQREGEEPPLPGEPPIIWAGNGLTP